MAPAHKFSAPKRDLYADLDFVETLLVHVLSIPRTVEKPVTERVRAFHGDFVRAGDELNAARIELNAARERGDAAAVVAGEAREKLANDEFPRLVALRDRYREEVFGRPYTELKRLLRQDTEDTTGRRGEIETFFNRYRPKATPREPHPDNQHRFIDGWAGERDHARCRRELADDMVAVRSGILEAMRTVQDPDEPPSELGVQAAYWNETLQGEISVRFAGLVSTVTGPRLVWLFKEVARARGEPVTWRELLKRRVAYLGATNQVREAETMDLEEDSIRRYGLVIRKQLAGFGKLWVQDGEQACWMGDSPPTS